MVVPVLLLRVCIGTRSGCCCCREVGSLLLCAILVWLIGCIVLLLDLAVSIFSIVGIGVCWSWE